MLRGLVLFASSKKRLLSHPDSPPPQAVLEIHLQGGGLSIHGPPLWAVPGSMHFYRVLKKYIVKQHENHISGTWGDAEQEFGGVCRNQFDLIFLKYVYSDVNSICHDWYAIIKKLYNKTT